MELCVPLKMHQVYHSAPCNFLAKAWKGDEEILRIWLVISHCLLGSCSTRILFLLTGVSQHEPEITRATKWPPPTESMQLTLPVICFYRKWNTIFKHVKNINTGCRILKQGAEILHADWSSLSIRDNDTEATRNRDIEMNKKLCSIN